MLCGEDVWRGDRRRCGWRGGRWSGGRLILGGGRCGDANVAIGALFLMFLKGVRGVVEVAAALC